MNRLQRGQFGDVNFNEYEVHLTLNLSFFKHVLIVEEESSKCSKITLFFSQPTVEFFSKDVMIHPVTNRPEDKRSFIPSLIEKEKVKTTESLQLLCFTTFLVVPV